MNETQYYSAKTENWGEVVGFEKDGYFHFLCFCGNNPHEAKTFFYTDLTPVKFVSQDAVVIEGFDLAYLEDMARSAENICNQGGFKNTARDFRKLRDQLVAQLTPPKPRPVEPTGFGAIVECNSQIGVFLSNRFRVVHLGNGKWAEENSSRIYKYSDLIDPVVLSPGQVK